MEYLRASGSMPLFSKIVEINNNKYLDGAIGDSIPVKKAIEMGYDKVIVVTTQPIDFKKKPYNMILFNPVYKKYKNFLNGIKNRHNLYNETLDYIKEEEKNKRIYVIRPSRKVSISKLEKNKKIIKEQYDLGYKDTNINSIKKYLNK